MGERLKIGLFSRHFPKFNGADGIATYTASLAYALGELGHEVHVLTTGLDCKAHPLAPNVFLHGIPLNKVPLFEKTFTAVRDTWHVSRAARRLAREYALDVFEFPNWEGLSRFFHFGGRICPLSVRVHTSWRKVLEVGPRREHWRDKLRCRWEDAACRGADSLCVSTFAHRLQMAQELNISEEKMAVLPLGLPDLDDPRLRRPRSKLQPPTLLYVGRLEPRKGTLDVLHALPEIVKKVPNIRLIMAGVDAPEAPGRVTYQQYFERAFPEALRLHVKFIGYQTPEQLDFLYEHASLLINPSVYESFGLVYVEAMRAALPSIGTLSGGIPEVIDHYNTGLVIRPRDPRGVAQAALTLLTNETLRLRMCATARERFEHHYTARVMALRVADHYRNVVNAGQPRPAEPVLMSPQR